MTAVSAAAQTNDEEYGAKIREYTTDERFLSELVDHLPASATVPSPLEHFGTIIGAPNILHTTSEIYGYMEALASASPRVVVRSFGQTEENRDMVEVVIADEATIVDLDRYRGYLNTLADPRNLSESEAEANNRRGQTDLLHNCRPPLSGNRCAGDGDGVGLPPGCRRRPVHTVHS